MLFLFLEYSIMNLQRKVNNMLFKTSKLYCKYVIAIINNNIKKFKFDTDSYKELDERLYKSYLKLEKIINSEFSD